jgi:hypothetical protein
LFGLIDRFVLSHHCWTMCMTVCRTSDTVWGNFPLIRIAMSSLTHWCQEPYYYDVYKYVSLPRTVSLSSNAVYFLNFSILIQVITLLLCVIHALRISLSLIW